MLGKTQTVHGVFLEVTGTGVLLTGRSGIGKSELALELISRGHRLVADDSVECALETDTTLRGFCPEPLRDFLEVRGVGILNVRRIFGEVAMKRSKALHLVIRLRDAQRIEMPPEARLNGLRGVEQMLGVDIPSITLPVAPGRNLAILAEAAVRSHLLERVGYNAAEDLTQRQLQAIEAGGN